MIYSVAAGGSGSRLNPITRFLNKHLIPTEPNKLMIDYPLEFLRKHKAKEVTVVTGSNHASQIVDYVADGEKYGFDRIEYAFQAKPAGIADVIKRLSHNSIEYHGLLLILGDNYFSLQQESIFSLDKAKAAAFQFDIGIENATSFGQAVYCDGRVVDIIEKPKNPTHGKILTGLYYFPHDVFCYVEELSPSLRNELEITDLLKIYLKEDRLQVFDVSGDWADLGEWNSLQQFWISRRNHGRVSRGEEAI